MAFHNSYSSYQIMFLVFVVFCCYSLKKASSFEYQVGGMRGWRVPPENDTRLFNDWASKNRFTIGDSIHFRYKKDSVMEVNETEYKKCNSTHPHYFSNAGNTVFNLEHSGAFYFISGATGHCDKGQRMIVRVLADEDDSQSNGCGSTTVGLVFAYGTIVSQFVFSYFF